MILMVDAVMAIVIIEGITLWAFGRARVLITLLAGLMLVIAMRLALGGAGLPWVGLALFAAGIAHTIDLFRTLSRGRGKAG